MEEIENVRIGERVDSDHMPLEIKTYGTGRKGKEEEIERREWNDETKEEYLKSCEG